MLNGPCHMHYIYVDGKRVSRHAMKDCRTFLKLQEAVGFKQTEAKSQGYRGSTNNTPSTNQQPTNGAPQGQGQTNKSNENDGGYIPSKGHIAAMIQPVPKSNKDQKNYISTSQPGNKLASRIHRVLTLVQAANRIQQRRPPDNSASAMKHTLGTQSSDRRIRHR
jgi:hypothetical protein